MQHSLIIGVDFLDTVEVNIKRGESFIRRIKDENPDEYPEVLKIDVETQADEIDLSHVKDMQHRQAVENLIREYRPLKTREVGIEMNLILQDDIPLYERPRRLSPQDKVEVDKQIKMWLEDGIIRQSHSDYASPIVLVNKKMAQLESALITDG